MMIYLSFFLLAMASARRVQHACDSELENFCSLTSNVTEVISPHQIILLTDDVSQQIRIASKYIRRCILQNHPAIIITFNHLTIVKKILEFPSFGSPRTTTLFIMLIHKDSSPLYKSVFTSYNKYWVRSIRPRWLTIYLNNDSNFNQSNFELYLLEAWKFKFLDFMIMETRNFNETVIHYYNPFKSPNFRSKTIDDSSSVFPDKLHDMNGYPLKTIFVHDPPSLLLEQNSTGHVISINSTDYWSIVTVSEVLNFTLKLLPTFENDYVNKLRRKSFTRVNSVIYNGTIDFGGNQLYLWGNEILSRSKNMWPDGHCALIRVLQKEQQQLPISFYVALTFIGIVVLILSVTSKLLKFNRQFWIWPNTLQVLIGVALRRHPQTGRERIVMGCMILLAPFYISDFYAKMAEVKLKVTERTYKSFEDLDGSGLTPLVYPQYFNKTFNAFEDDSQVMNSLKRKARFWYNPLNCADQILKRSNNSFCILSEHLGSDMIDKFRREKDGKSKFKIVKPCFWITWKGFAFTPKSPYVEKFDQVLSRIVEAGLLAKWYRIMAPPQVNVSEDDEGHENLALQLIIIVGMGCKFALIAFLAEIWYYKWHLSKMNRPKGK